MYEIRPLMMETRSLPLIGSPCPKCGGIIAGACEVTGHPYRPERIVPPCGCPLTTQEHINAVTLPGGNQ